MKFKKLTKEQVIISLDRLTRFKNTREKYLRVFSDIIISNLIEPKIKKTDLEDMDFALITAYAEEIINDTLGVSSDLKVNNLLKEYENNIFVNDKETQALLNNKINYNGALNFINDEAAINLKWLKKVIETKTIASDLREKHLLKYPIKEVILVEGITEEILLPTFAKLLNYDFYSKGVQIIAAGGKNQVVKMYYKLAKELRIPIFVLLDKDAEENINQIKPKLRKIDRIHLVSCGEFEDLLPKSLIVKTVNAHFKNFLQITELDLEKNMQTAKILEEIFKTKGLHEFKKAEFAKLVRENIVSLEDISTEIKAIIREISITNKMLDTEKCS